jgi:RsiW-degrading membrane proteinase PrsW (M82 family)
MTLAYERPAGRGGWGTIVAGERSIPVRQAVLIGGAAIWLGQMLIATGAAGVTALWTNLYFLGVLLLLTAGTLTIGLRWVAFFFLAGGFAMALMFPIGAVLDAIELFSGATNTAIVFPITEEVLKILPVVGLLWWARRAGAWSLGASDVLLMAAAAGAGFGLLEDAYIRRDFGWPDQLAWLPVTEIIGGQMIAGHGIWSAIAGAAIGLALLLRSRGRGLALLVGASGFVVAVLDHVRNNYGNRADDLPAQLLQTIGLDGWLAIYLFVGLVAAVIAADAWVIHRSRPRPPEHTFPPRPAGRAGWLQQWHFLLKRRELAFANFQFHRTDGADREHVRQMASRLDFFLGMTAAPEANDEGQ